MNCTHFCEVLSRSFLQKKNLIKSSNPLVFHQQTQKILESRGNPRTPLCRPMEKICVVGSGHWGSCIAKIVGENVERLRGEDSRRWGGRVSMWVFEETVSVGEGREAKLSDVINETRENVKYLPGVRLPPCVCALPDLKEAARDATLLVFVLPHQFVGRACAQLAGVVQPGARAISLIKGLDLGVIFVILIQS